MEDNNMKKVENDDKIQIIATLFPQYDFAKHIVRDKAEVKLFHSVNVEVEANEKLDAYHKIKEQIAFAPQKI